VEDEDEEDLGGRREGARCRRPAASVAAIEGVGDDDAPRNSSSPFATTSISFAVVLGKDSVVWSTTSFNFLCSSSTGSIPTFALPTFSLAFPFIFTFDFLVWHWKILAFSPESYPNTRRIGDAISMAGQERKPSCSVRCTQRNHLQR
jgi:hypothetical protein